MYDGYPLHRLNSAHIRLWLYVPVLQRQLASWLGRQYKTGVVLLSPTLFAFAKVAPNGQVTPLAPPFKRFQFWQCDNKPSLRYNECACRNYIDPESGDRWGARDRERLSDIHHPFCQGRETAAVVWKQSFKSATARMGEGKSPQARLDEWIRTTKDVGGR